MTVVQSGSINTGALVVPDLYVQIQPPSNTLINGVPTNTLGVVGTATWGPTNSPTIIGSLAQYAANFGAIQARRWDMGTVVAVAALQGASNFRCVRITDGTDLAATIVVQTTCITFTSKYSGTLGNTQQVTVAAGSQTGTWRVTATLPGQAPEVFDNIGFGLAANPLWVAIAAAVNSGVSGVRGPSQLIIATAGAGVTAPTAATYTLAAGTDGATTITTVLLLGQDTVPRKGMYALRNTGASVAVLADCADSTSWTTQVSYGLSEGTYMVDCGPSGDTISGAATVKGTAGIDSYAIKLVFGDWVYYLDTYNNQTRLVAPSGFAAGLLSNLSPQNSGLNKQIQGVVATQKSALNQVYSNADLQALSLAGIDLICNPVPGGNYYGMRFGRNTSSNAVIHGDNYTRMTNFIAYTLNAGMGPYVGKLQSLATQQQAKGTIVNFLANLWQQNMIGNSLGTTPFSVQIDATNNPQSRVALGYMQADVKVQYLSVIEYFLVNVEGGQSVVINRVGS